MNGHAGAAGSRGNRVDNYQSLPRCAWHSPGPRPAQLLEAVRRSGEIPSGSPAGSAIWQLMGTVSWDVM